MKNSNLDGFLEKVRAGYRIDTEKTSARSMKAERRAEERKRLEEKTRTEPVSKESSARRSKSIETVQNYLKSKK